MADNFSRLKRVVSLDRPMFKKVNPNDPVTYKTSGTPVVAQPASIPEPLEEANPVPGGLTPSQQAVYLKTNAQNALRVPSSMQNSQLDQDESETSEPSNPIAHDVVNHIINNMDPDEALDAIDKTDDGYLNNTILSDQDKGFVWDKVINTLKKSGKIN